MEIYDQPFKHPIKLVKVMEYALGTTIGLLMFLVSLFIIGMVVYYFTGERYFSPSVHKTNRSKVDKNY